MLPPRRAPRPQCKEERDEHKPRGCVEAGGGRCAGGAVERGGLREVFSACVQRGSQAGGESGVTSVMQVVKFRF